MPPPPLPPLFCQTNCLFTPPPPLLCQTTITVRLQGGVLCSLSQLRLSRERVASLMVYSTPPYMEVHVFSTLTMPPLCICTCVCVHTVPYPDSWYCPACWYCTHVPPLPLNLLSSSVPIATSLLSITIPTGRSFCSCVVHTHCVCLLCLFAWHTAALPQRTRHVCLK